MFQLSSVVVCFDSYMTYIPCMGQVTHGVEISHNMGYLGWENIQEQTTYK